MERVAAKQRWDEGDGRFVVDAWCESGLPMETFAAEHGFGVWRLRQWVSRIEVGVAPEDSADEEQRLVPAVVTVGAEAHASGPALIIRLPDGIEVELRDVARVEPEEIGRLVAEVRRAR